ncbi:MAG: NAD(P)/FAD-dependent oxidoreductase, partial [Methanobacterium sp.]|nr:NAD(P)/FAD-dependent oxidoreductase [Methanobacterium sp.]
MEIYDIAVVGGGPAGCMAAIQGAMHGKKVIILDKNDKIGRKLLLTGNGRCNLTNSSNLDVFMDKFGREGFFYRDAFQTFNSADLLKFFQEYGLEFKEEEDGRVFPVTDKAESVLHVLNKAIEELQIKIIHNFHVQHLYKHSKIFKLTSHKDDVLTSYSTIMATGGASYRSTGSTGDGFKIAEKLGHKITDLQPGEVPLTLKEGWAHDLKGITLDDVGLSVQIGGRIKPLKRGGVLFTHFGLSGPAVLDVSHEVVKILKTQGDLKLYVDFTPDIYEKELEENLIDDFSKSSKKNLKNYFKTYLPKKMVEPILTSMSLDPDRKLNQITKKERKQFIKILKSLPLTINGHLPLDKAMITCGGVSQKEINPKTMESRLVPDLYFAGEIIDGCGH